MRLPINDRWLSRAHSPSRLVASAANSRATIPSRCVRLLAQEMPHRPAVHLHNPLQLESCKISVSWLIRRLPLPKSRRAVCAIRPWSNVPPTFCAMTRQSFGNSATKSPISGPRPSQQPNSSTPSFLCSILRALNWVNSLRSSPRSTKTNQNEPHYYEPGMIGVPSTKITQHSQAPEDCFPACLQAP